MVKQKKNKLTIFLAKSEFDTIEKIIAKNADYIEKRIFTDTGTLLIRRSPDKTPGWIDGFFERKLETEKWMTSNVSAVLIVPITISNGSVRIFALTFGYGRSWLANEAIERRFGLKCVLNSVQPNSLRQIRKTLVSGNARKSSEQMPRKASISDFSLDYEQDLLEGITAVGNIENLLEGPVTGSDALTVNTTATLSNVADYLKEVFDIYQSDAYKENFAWVDHIASVKDKSLELQLEARAVEALNSGDQSIWFAVPEVIDWDLIAGFRYTQNGTTFDDILVKDVLHSLSNELADFQQLKHKRILAISSENEEVLYSWAANRCLYGEIQFNGNQYCITDGSWYKIDQDYSDEINQDYSQTKVTTKVFPEYKKKYSGESEYNEVLAKSSDDYLLMDKKNIMFGGNGSRIELCDVLSNDGTLIHVKRYGGSSVMSHLFNQGLVSMDLIKSEPNFVKKANQTIAQEDQSGRFAISPDRETEVVYGIVTNDSAALPNVPFFSKVAFHHVKRRLKSMGVKVSIGAIHEIE